MSLGLFWLVIFNPTYYLAESFVDPINLQNIYWQNEIIFVQHSSFLYDCVCLCACAENLHFPLFLWFKSAYQTQFELNFNWQVV